MIFMLCHLQCLNLYLLAYSKKPLELKPTFSNNVTWMFLIIVVFNSSMLVKDPFYKLKCLLVGNETHAEIHKLHAAPIMLYNTAGRNKFRQIKFLGPFFTIHDLYSQHGLSYLITFRLIYSCAKVLVSIKIVINISGYSTSQLPSIALHST